MGLKSQKGNLTIDFIFAVVLIFSVTILLFVMSFTLSIVEVAQYISFSGARTYMAANISPERQEELARNKIEALLSNPVYRQIFRRSDWFRINPDTIAVGDFTDEYVDDENNEFGSDTFWGARFEFQSSILELNIPFYGSISPEGDGFKANVQSFLGRESTFSECRENFELQRWERIKALNGKYNTANSPQESYKVMIDNGC